MRVLRGIWKGYGYKSQGEIRRQLYPAKRLHGRIKVTGSETDWSGRMWQSRDRVTTLVKMEGAIKVECRRKHGSQLWTVSILNYVTRAKTYKYRNSVITYRELLLRGVFWWTHLSTSASFFILYRSTAGMPHRESGQRVSSFIKHSCQARRLHLCLQANREPLTIC